MDNKQLTHLPVLKSLLSDTSIAERADLADKIIKTSELQYLSMIHAAKTLVSLAQVIDFIETDIKAMYSDGEGYPFDYIDDIKTKTGDSFTLMLFIGLISDFRSGVKERYIRQLSMIEATIDCTK